MIKPFLLKIYNLTRINALRVCPRLATKVEFRLKTGYWPDLENPKTFNEKLTWMKFFWYDQLAVQCADKYAVRDFVRKRGLENILNPLYGVYEKVDEIDFPGLPGAFVLKVTNGCGLNIICKNKQELDWEATKEKIRHWQKGNYYQHNLEWVYRDIKPRIVCERFIETPDGKPPKDYKVFCFNGEPKMLFVATDRIDHQTKFDFYTLNWEHIPVKNHYPNASELAQKPERLEEIIAMSKILSKGFPHVRVDFYIESGEIIFGEMTFFHFSGNVAFEPFKYDLEFGKYLSLPRKNFYKGYNKQGAIEDS